MEMRQPRYSKEEFARRGQALYERQVRPQVEASNIGRIVAIDIETGEFEIGDDALAASDRPSLRVVPRRSRGWCGLDIVRYTASGTLTPVVCHD